jgi:hypothetical protein
MSKPIVLDFHSFNKNIIETKIKLGHPETRNSVIMIPIITSSALFKTPKMYMPFKPKIQNQIGGYVRLAFDNINIDESVGVFFNFINDIDEYLEHELLKTKIMTNKNIKYFQKTIKQTDGFSDYFNINFNISETKVYDSALKNINIQNVEGNFYAHFIIELTGIYFNKQTKKMRVIWNLVQFKLDKIKNIIDECLFIDEDHKNLELKSNQKNEKEVINNFQPVMLMKDNEILAKFYKMLSMGIPKPAVQHKMTLMNIDSRFIDYDSDFNLYNLPNDLKKILIPKTNSNSNSSNDIDVKNNNSPTGSTNSLFSSLNQFNKTKLKKVNEDDKAKKIKNQLSLMKKTMPVPTLEEIQEARKRLFEKKTNKK